MFPDLSSTLQAIFRWFHIIAGITWIGHLYFFNFVNTPFQGGLAKELKPTVNPPLVLRALFFFRGQMMNQTLNHMIVPSSPPNRIHIPRSLIRPSGVSRLPPIGQ